MFTGKVHIPDTLERVADTPNVSMEHMTTRGNTCVIANFGKNVFSWKICFRDAPQQEQPSILWSWKYWIQNWGIVGPGTSPWRTARGRVMMKEKDRYLRGCLPDQDWRRNSQSDTGATSRQWCWTNLGGSARNLQALQPGQNKTLHQCKRLSPNWLLLCYGSVSPSDSITNVNNALKA